MHEPLRWRGRGDRWQRTVRAFDKVADAIWLFDKWKDTDAQLAFVSNSSARAVSPMRVRSSFVTRASRRHWRAFSKKYAAVTICKSPNSS